MKVIEFLKAARLFYGATAEGDTPHVRPLGFVMEYDGKLAFYSDNRKNMFKQLKANPKIEIAAIDAKMNTLRMSGKVNFITSPESKKAALDAMPDLAKMGYAADDNIFEIYTIDDLSYSLTTIMGKKLDIEL